MSRERGKIISIALIAGGNSGMQVWECGHEGEEYLVSVEDGFGLANIEAMYGKKTEICKRKLEW